MSPATKPVFAEQPLKENQLYRLVLGKVIEGLRRQKSLTQEEFAGSLGLTQSTLSRIESGKIAVDLFQLKKIAEELDVTADDIERRADDALRVAEAAAATVSKAVKGNDWWGFLTFMALMGLVAFAVAAVIDTIPEPGKGPGHKPGPPKK